MEQPNNRLSVSGEKRFSQTPPYKTKGIVGQDFPCQSFAGTAATVREKDNARRAFDVVQSVIPTVIGGAFCPSERQTQNGISREYVAQ